MDLPLTLKALDEWASARLGSFLDVLVEKEIALREAEEEKAKLEARKPEEPKP